MAAVTHIQTPKQSVGFKRILMATDFSETSRRAIPYALALARLYEAEVYFMHAIPARPHQPNPQGLLPKELGRQRLDAEQLMKHFVETSAVGDLIHHSLVEQGPVADVICSIGERENIDLLVLGTHGRGGLKKLALGSVAEEMLRVVPCPTLTVGQNAAALMAGIPVFQRILFATDFGAGAARALPFALALTEKYRASLTLLHIMPPIPILDSGPAAYGAPACLADELVSLEAKEKEESTRKLKQMIPHGTEPACEPEYVIGTDSPAEGILGAAVARRIDLIVMGAHRVSYARTAAHMPGAVAHHVICEARCPVLTVRG
jgi:nucleotide-binding universal stress UspA family protein